MRFNIPSCRGLRPLLSVGTVLLLTACGAKADRHPRYASSSAVPTSQSNASLWTGDGANFVVTTERRGRTFSLFRLDPFEHVQTFALPLPEHSQLILPSQDGQYFVAASTSGYAIVQNSGAVRTNPAALSGTLQTLAFSPNANVAVVRDDRQSVVLLTFDAQGQVTGSWQSTTKFPNGQYAISGAMLGDGTYAAALSGATIAIVDVAKSVREQSWQVRTFDLAGASDMSWTAAVTGLGFNAVLVQDGTRLVTVNTDTGALIDQHSLGSAKVLWRTYSGTPHVISQRQEQIPDQKNDLIFVSSGGKLGSTSFQGSSEQIVTTWLDSTAGSVAVAYNALAKINASVDPYSGLDAEHIIARFHTSDGSKLDLTTIDDSVQLKLRSNYIFTTYPSPLGKSERLTYGSSPTVQSVLRYAFSAISQRNSH